MKTCYTGILEMANHKAKGNEVLDSRTLVEHVWGRFHLAAFNVIWGSFGAVAIFGDKIFKMLLIAPTLMIMNRPEDLETFTSNLRQPCHWSMSITVSKNLCRESVLKARMAALAYPHLLADRTWQFHHEWNMEILRESDSTDGSARLR